MVRFGVTSVIPVLGTIVVSRSLTEEFHNNGNLDTDGMDDLLPFWLRELLKKYFILINVASVSFLWPQETYKQIPDDVGD